MKVYIVLTGEAHEGGRVEGVYAQLEDAVKMAKLVPTHFSGGWQEAEVNGIDRSTMETTHPEIYNGGATEEMWEVYEAKVATIGGPDIWTGVWPGVAECIEFGWYSKWVPPKPGESGHGWQQCSKDDPDAGPNLNRLVSENETRWSQKQRRWVLR